jgi:RNA polymerase sigma-70 factor (ECF subfamily)
MQGDDQLTAQTDSLLLRRFLAGDQASFEELFLRHYPMVYGVLYRLAGSREEAEDLAQEVFVKLYRRPLREGDNVAGWLYRVALNTGYNALRASSRRGRREVIAGHDEAASPLPEEEAQRRELARGVREALLRIPQRDARLLILSEAGFNYREIADIVGVAPGSVGTLLARARKAFLSAYGGDEEKVDDGSQP